MKSGNIQYKFFDWKLGFLKYINMALVVMNFWLLYKVSKYFIYIVVDNIL